jgi:hypothetical protein
MDILSKIKHIKAVKAAESKAISIREDFINEIKEIHHIENDIAMLMIRDSMKTILDDITHDRGRLYWSALDTMGFYVLVDNRMVTVGQADKYAKLLRTFDEWINKYDKSLHMVIDCIDPFMRFAFSKHTIRGFQDRFDKIVEGYSKTDIMMLRRILGWSIIAIKQGTNPSTTAEYPSDCFTVDDKHLYDVTREVCLRRVASAPKNVRTIPHKRLEFFMSLVEKKVSGYVPTTPTPTEGPVDAFVPSK